MSTAADAAGVTRRNAYIARANDPEFKADWDDALARSLDGLEEEGFRRAKQESDTLLIFLLKSHRTETYGDKGKLDVTTRQGVQSVREVLHGPDDPDDDTPSAD